MKRVTPQQRRVLGFVLRYLRDNGYAPTLREICQFLGSSSTNAAHDALSGLERKGMITRVKGAARTIVLTEAGRALVFDEKEQPA